MTVLVDILPPPELQNAAESIVERWLQRVGTQVRANEPLVELNTDKAVIEVPAPAAGVLQEILKQANDPVQPGDVLGRIATNDSQKDRNTISSPASGKTPVTAPAPVVSSLLEAPARTELLSPAVRQLVQRHKLD